LSGGELQVLLAADRKIGEMRSASLAAGTDAKWGTLEAGVWVVWWKREGGKRCDCRTLCVGVRVKLVVPNR
jgi:hypothetical protein